MITRTDFEFKKNRKLSIQNLKMPTIDPNNNSKRINYSTEILTIGNLKKLRKAIFRKKKKKFYEIQLSSRLDRNFFSDSDIWTYL